MQRSKACFPTPLAVLASLMRWTLTGAMLGILVVILMVWSDLYPPAARLGGVAGLGVAVCASVGKTAGVAVGETPAVQADISEASSMLWISRARYMPWFNS
jgi:hypothetical protein